MSNKEVLKLIPASKIAHSVRRASQPSSDCLTNCATTSSPLISFSSFKQSLTSNVNYLKRRFSSGDLSSEADEDEIANQTNTMNAQCPPITTPPTSNNNNTGDLTLNLKNSSRTTSAPSSPAKNRESLLQRVQSLTGQAREQGAQIIGAAVSTATNRVSLGKEKYSTLLVIDDANTDWSKYFRAKKLINDYEIRVEQSEFRDISLSTSTDNGLMVSINMLRNGTRVTRTFKPDFVLIRQNLKDGQEDYKNILLGFQFANIQSLNNLFAIYNFQDKPWVFAQLLKIQRRLGRDHFPVIEQTYYPNHREMLSNNGIEFPVVVKLGHAYGGVGKIRIGNQTDFQDIVSIIQSTNSYCTIEPYIESKYDIHVQKIGSNYKAFMRKSISGNWKTNIGSAILEQLPVADNFKFWLDEISEMFGGLDICALEAVVSKDGQKFIIDVKDSALNLMGETQEEDRRLIADLVVAKMNNQCKPPIPNRPPSIISQSRSESSEIKKSDEITSSTVPPPPIPAHPPTLSNVGRGDSQVSVSSSTGSISNTSITSQTPAMPPPPIKRDDSNSSSSFRSVFQRQNSQQQASQSHPSAPSNEDAEDTMKNLRKTFAGIFGDM